MCFAIPLSSTEITFQSEIKWMSDKWRTTNWQQCCQHKCSPLSQGTPTAYLFIHKRAPNCAKNMFTFIRKSYPDQPVIVSICFVHSLTIKPVILALLTLHCHSWTTGKHQPTPTNLEVLSCRGPYLCCPEGMVAVGNLEASNPWGGRTETSPSAANGWWMAESLQFN